LAALLLAVTAGFAGFANSSAASQLTVSSPTAESTPASVHQPVSDSTAAKAAVSARSPINPLSHLLTTGSIAWHGNFHELSENSDGLIYMPGKG
jgi:hypothetical protein